MRTQTIIIALLTLFTYSCNQNKETKKEIKIVETEVSFNDQVTDYIQKFPYQDTYNYMTKYTGGKASNLNTWIIGQEPVLVKAGEDKIVRMNNDTYYKMAFVDLSNGIVRLSSTNGSDERFSSFQLMDDHNANFKNVIHPKGDYYLYFGEVPTELEGTLIESPSKIAVALVRVEVRDMNNNNDIESAKTIFKGITITGPEIEKFPELDLFSAFDSKVIERGNVIMDSVIRVVPFRLCVASPEQIGKEVPVVYHSAGTRSGWAGPITSHSAYEAQFFDIENSTLDASKGNYTITMSVPPVDAFWSITVYDSKRGGFLHPNKENKYHINNTAVEKNEDGTITFNFKTKCEGGDLNCLEVPAGPFDIVSRYYLPHNEIRTGEWKMPIAKLVK